VIGFPAHILPQWLNAKLRALRQDLGAEYEVQFVACRPAGKRSDELSLGLQIELRGSASELNGDNRVASDDTSQTIMSEQGADPGTLISWEAIERRLKDGGYSDQEIRCEEELRRRIDIKALVAQLEIARDRLPNERNKSLDAFGNIKLAEVELAKLPVTAPKGWMTTTLTLPAITFATASLITGDLFYGACPAIVAFLASVMIDMDRNDRAALRFNPTSRSPHLEELRKTLTARGFVCKIACDKKDSYSEVMKLTLAVLVRGEIRLD